MKPIRAAFAAFCISTAAQADEIPWVDLQVGNDMRGHVVLTHEPCDVHLDNPVADKLYRAYSTWDEGTDAQQMHEACWFTPHVDLTQFPPDSEDRIVRFVYILTPDHRIYKSLWKDYEPVGTKQPQEQEY
jgi:hypothetical protein